jgi:hypothetical protein
MEKLFSNYKVFLSTLGIGELKNISKDNILVNAYIPNFEKFESIKLQRNEIINQIEIENEKETCTNDL